MERDKIIGINKELDGEPVIFSPPIGRIHGRHVLGWSGYCGTYGAGGPGFFGLRLAATEHYPEEWLMLRLWSSNDWLNVNGRWLAALPDQYDDAKRPLYSNFADAYWDEFSPLVTDKVISKFEIHKRTFKLEIGEARIELLEDPASRPVNGGTRTPRVLSPKDDLRTAWIIAPKPWVRIYG